MLRELNVRNFAVIESTQVEFHDGFHVLTGETGAGKSILIDALTVIVGGRAASDLIRFGCDKAEVEAVFDVPADHPVWIEAEAQGLDPDPAEPLIIRRELAAAGKNVCRINGRVVTMNTIREIGEYLVNIHGQHEHQSLFKTERHLEWLDLYAGEQAASLHSAYQKAYGSYQQATRDLQELIQSNRNNVQMIDLYKFQVNEIAAAQLVVGEDDALHDERQKLMYSVKRRDASSEAYELLYEGGGIDALSRAIARLEEIEKYDQAEIQPIVEVMRGAYYQMEEALRDIRTYRDQVDSDPERLAEIEQRLDLIHTLKRKYGDSIESILAMFEQTLNTIESIENKDEAIERLKQASQASYAEAVELAKQLSAIRHEAASRLAKAIETELKQLLMERTVFAVDIQTAKADEIKLGSHGIDEVKFLIAPNPGEPLKPLNKIASGGEMSRVMLALKAIFAQIDLVPTLIFDEVDTGVSGRAAQAIAEKLSKLSQQCQVFSITHLPQVACMADHHYEINKEIIGDRTATSVTQLDSMNRVEELARMLGGVEVTEKTRQHAREMLELASKLKHAQ